MKVINAAHENDVNNPAKKREPAENNKVINLAIRTMLIKSKEKRDTEKYIIYFWNGKSAGKIFRKNAGLKKNNYINDNEENDAGKT